MAEINYKELGKHLKERKGFSPVYLFYGEEMLYKTAFDEVLNAMIPASERSLNYDRIDNDNVYEAIERVNTFSLLSGTKAVALCDSRIFYSKQDESSFLEKAKEAYNGKDIKKAAKFFLSLLGVAKLSLDDVKDKSSRHTHFKSDSEVLDDDKWLEEIIAYCAENNLSPLAAKDNAAELEKAVEKGFPEGNHLLITTDMADKRRTLFKIIAQKGTVVDCAVPRGERKADKMAQENVLNEQMKTILARSKIRMDRDAYLALCEMTGFDLRTFSNNLENLVHYAGDRKNITAADVEAVLKRTKQDPIYELTNALSDRNAEDSLFFVNSLLSAGFAPLQILGAMINQIRKVLITKGFTESPQGKAWNPRMSYTQFQNAVMSEIQNYDSLLMSQVEEWESMLSEDRDDEKKKGKKKPATDIQIMKSQASSYPVYIILMKSEKFTREELIHAMEYLSEADLRLKTGSRNPKLILEEAVFRICRRN